MKSKVRTCCVCGCTADNPCITEGKPCCLWAFPDYCDACFVIAPDNWYVPKQCRFCAFLQEDSFRFGRAREGKPGFTCSKGRFNADPMHKIVLNLGYWFAWGGIWKANKRVKAAQKKCPLFTVFPRFADVNKLTTPSRKSSK